jgi:hypothetical protein
VISPSFTPSITGASSSSKILASSFKVFTSSSFCVLASSELTSLTILLSALYSLADLRVVKSFELETLFDSSLTKVVKSITF